MDCIVLEQIAKPSPPSDVEIARSFALAGSDGNAQETEQEQNQGRARSTERCRGAVIRIGEAARGREGKGACGGSRGRRHTDGVGPIPAGTPIGRPTRSTPRFDGCLRCVIGDWKRVRASSKPASPLDLRPLVVRTRQVGLETRLDSSRARLRVSEAKRTQRRPGAGSPSRGVGSRVTSGCCLQCRARARIRPTSVSDTEGPNLPSVPGRILRACRSREQRAARLLIPRRRRGDSRWYDSCGRLRADTDRRRLNRYSGALALARPSGCPRQKRRWKTGMGYRGMGAEKVSE
jgi:hypothetical protein